VDRVRREHFCQLGGTLRIKSEMNKDGEVEKPERGTSRKMEKYALSCWFGS
jgi:hypothetical protein